MSTPTVQHRYIIGATRTGKSNYMMSLVEGAFAFIDKHGTAAREIADSRSCVYWRPADIDFPISLNPLQNVAPDDRWKVTADIVSIVADIWDLGEATPRLLYYLRAAIRLLLDNPNTTLLDTRRLLSDDTYRGRLLTKCTDIETRQTWDEFSMKDARQQAQEIGSLQNKVAALADPLPLRLVLGSPTSTVNIRKIIERGQCLCLDLSGMGDEPARLLGAIVINQFKQAAETFPTPIPYDLYIDEFQNFGTSIISTILSESGKFGLSLTLAHQFISQLDQQVRDAVLGNCSTVVSFRVGPNDAPIIADAIDWSARDLQDLGRGVARIRTLVNGRPSSADRMVTTKTELATGHMAANVRNTRANYARPRAMVENPNAPRRKDKPGWGWGKK